MKEVILTKLEKQILNELRNSNLSPQEVKKVIENMQKGTHGVKTYSHHFPKKHAKFGVISDTHIGHKAFDEQLWDKAGKYFKKQGIDTIYHSGDILEGMSGRPGHVYELDQIGATAQKNRARELLEYFDGMTIYGITGNHDDWFKVKNDNGLIVGEDLEQMTNNFEFLGEMEADVKIAPNVTIKLFHSTDGSAYAISYKLQKLMESLEGGHKPNMILSGHYHKALYMFNRNIHGYECGTFCGQTPFMRGKKLPAHKGFWIIDAYMDKNGIEEVVNQFVPAYN